MTCAKSFPPEVDEFSEAGLAARPSVKVKAPGIEGCLAWAECTVEEEIAREKYVLIIGRVVHLEADDRFFSLEKGMDFEKAMPLCIMGSDKGMHFVRPTHTGYKG